jgi:hypothetical protein
MLYRMSQVKLPKAAHTSRPWRIHEIVSDFRLEDVWALSTPGAADEWVGGLKRRRRERQDRGSRG